MNQANNKRSRTTKMKIRNAAVELLQTMSLPKLTVHAICERADINRSSFYVHYQDVFDMMEKLGKEHEDEVIELFTGFDGASGNYFAPENLKIIFEHIKDNEYFYRAYFKGFGTNIIEHGFDELYKGIYRPLYITQGGRPEYGHYHFTFFKNGLLAVVQAWLELGCPETPDEMVKIIWNCVPTIPS
jgi:AcrR family transcriptional regulator